MGISDHGYGMFFTIAVASENVLREEDLTEQFFE